MVRVTKHNPPALRFAGFDDEWTQSRLSDHLTLSEDTNANLEFGREDVYAVSLEEGLVNQIEFHGRSFAGKNLDNYDVIHAGEIVYTKSPLKFTPYGIFKSHFGATGIVSPLYAVYRTKPHADARFVQDYFALPERLNAYLSPLVNKGAKNTMNISDWNALGGAVTFPPSLEEQRAIGELFSDLDALIEQHRAKHLNLQQTKTALMQRMFPQDGADVPELRMDGQKARGRGHLLGKLLWLSPPPVYTRTNGRLRVFLSSEPATYLLLLMVRKTQKRSFLLNSTRSYLQGRVVFARGIS